MARYKEWLVALHKYYMYVIIGYYRLMMWWECDVWAWIINAPYSYDKGHCLGRRTNKPVFCNSCCPLNGCTADDEHRFYVDRSKYPKQFRQL